MIGDWVVLKSNGVQPDTKIRITELSTDGGFVDDCDNLIGYEELYPIHLTKDILVKNGFEYERNIGYIFDDYDGNVVIYDDYNNRLKILQNHDVSFNREFFSKVCVHYLQHALRLCGIRKEIEL